MNLQQMFPSLSQLSAAYEQGRQRGAARPTKSLSKATNQMAAVAALVLVPTPTSFDAVRDAFK